jgi:hypothetical protein
MFRFISTGFSAFDGFPDLDGFLRLWLIHHRKGSIARVRRQGCQMVYLQTRNPNLSKHSLEGLGMLLYFMSIWNIYGHWGKFMAVWYSFGSFGIFFPFWYVWTKKNLATLSAATE